MRTIVGLRTPSPVLFGLPTLCLVDVAVGILAGFNEQTALVSCREHEQNQLGGNQRRPGLGQLQAEFERRHKAFDRRASRVTRWANATGMRALLLDPLCRRALFAARCVHPSRASGLCSTSQHIGHSARACRDYLAAPPGAHHERQGMVDRHCEGARCPPPLSWTTRLM